jgi:hypothetical protein
LLGGSTIRRRDDDHDVETSASEIKGFLDGQILKTQKKFPINPLPSPLSRERDLSQGREQA